MKVWKGNEVECETAQHALFPDPIGRVGWPSREPISNVVFNRGTQIHPHSGLWVTQLFLLMKGKLNGRNSHDVSEHKLYKDRIWSRRNVPAFWMWWAQGVKMSKMLPTVQVVCSYSITWKLSLKEKTRCGETVISATAVEVVQRRLNRDLPSWLIHHYVILAS